jgi:beta-lactamase superfamily II metal-dependent hydrolase
MRISKSCNLEVIVFNVERGLSIYIKTPQNYSIIYDFGSTADFSPTKLYKDSNILEYLSDYSEPSFGSKIIAQSIISHPHLDHISDLTNENTLFIGENSFYVTCQNDKDSNKKGQAIDFSRINNPDEAADEIENYKSLYRNRCLPLSTLINYSEENINLKIGYYYITSKQAEDLFPNDDQNYSNSLSLVLYLYYNGYSILIPGDITPEAFEIIYNGKCEKRFTDYSIKQSIEKGESWAKETSDQPNLKHLLKKKLTVLIAPHHGLESGYPEFLFNDLGENKPDIIVISDKRHNAENSGKIHKNYQNGVASLGIIHEGKKRYSLSTANDGHIKISFKENNYSITSSNDLNEILT